MLIWLAATVPLLICGAYTCSSLAALELADLDIMLKNGASKRALAAVEQREKSIAAGRLGLWLTVLLLGACWANIVSRLSSENYTLLVLEAIALALLLSVSGCLAYSFSAAWAASKPEEALAKTFPVSSLAIFTLRPLSSLMTAGGNKIASFSKGPPVSTYQQLRRITGRSSLQLGAEESSMIAAVLDLPSRSAAQIMTPRPVVATVGDSETIGAAAQICVESGHTRLVVTRGDQGAVAGLVHAASLLAEVLAGNRDHPIKALVRDTVVVPEAKPLNQLLLYLQNRQQYLAVVVDEYGKVAGIVSIEDILEEIVGEIEDESDLKGADLRALPGGAFLVSGYLSLDELERQGAALPKMAAVNSVGGYIFSYLGNLPVVGDQVEVGDWLLQVMEMDQARVASIKITSRLPQ